MNKNRENFIKYSNDLYFHHLLVENEKIRTMAGQADRNRLVCLPFKYCDTGSDAVIFKTGI